MKKTKYGTVKGIRIGMVLFLVAVIFVVGMMPHPKIIVEETGNNDESLIETITEVITGNRSWHVIWEGSLTDLVMAAEADPGVGASGILSVYIINHTATPDTTYTQNASGTLEAWCAAAGLGYANADDTNVEIDHSTDFDILTRVRGNKTHCWNGTAFIDAYLRVRISSADLNLAADTVATGVPTDNDSGKSFIWVNFYIDEDQGASNLNIARDETAEITNIKFEAYY